MTAGVDPARAIVLDVLNRVDATDSYANLLLPETLRRNGLTGRDAAFATELCYGTLRRRGSLDAVVAEASTRPVGQIEPAELNLLRLGSYQLLHTRVGAHAAVSSTVALTRSAVGER